MKNNTTNQKYQYQRCIADNREVIQENEGDTSSRIAINTSRKSGVINKGKYVGW
tara:strand:+ start:291 stop:452 length:162 start_codon:yes stop_codon:yes gene_type:complete